MKEDRTETIREKTGERTRDRTEMIREKIDEDAIMNKVTDAVHQSKEAQQTIIMILGTTENNLKRTEPSNKEDIGDLDAADTAAILIDL